MQRDPTGVAAKADDAPVRVRRRDGVPLVLMREDRAEDAVRGAVTAARALRMASKRLDPSEVAMALHEEFPWLDVLPPADLALFTTEFSRAIEASAEWGEWGLFTRTITEWKATAAVHAEPELHRILSTPATEDFGPVQPPRRSRMTGKRGDRVTPPGRPGGREARDATTAAAKGWEELCQAARSSSWEAFVVLTERPQTPENASRQHRSRGSLATFEVRGKVLEQWQYEVTGSGRIWYCPDPESRIVRVVPASPRRLKATEQLIAA